MKRKTYSAEFKAEIAREALLGRESLTKLAQQYGVNPSVLSRWKAQADRALRDVFRVGEEPGIPGAPAISAQRNKAGKQESKEAMDFRGQAASTVHEINNSLGIVICYVQLLRKDIPEDHPIAPDLALIETHAQAARRQVEELRRQVKRDQGAATSCGNFFSEGADAEGGNN